MLSHAQPFNSPLLDSDPYLTFDEKDKRSSSIKRSSDLPIKSLPQISAIVVFHERQDERLLRCLRSLREAATRIDEEVEIIVIENGARSNLWEETAALWDGWIDIATNVGASVARNHGAEIARGDLLAFIDDDGQVGPDFFRAALPYFSDHRVLGIRGRVVALNHPYFSSLASHYERGQYALDDALITEGASIIRRIPFLDVNGFPTELFGHEGIALTFQLQQYEENAKTLYAPNVLFYHDYAKSWQEFIEKSIRYAHNESQIHDEDMKTYLVHYLQTSFPSSPRPLREQVARIALRTLQGGIQQATRLHAHSHRKLARYLRKQKDEAHQR